MRPNSLLVPVLGIVTLVLSACSSSISGEAQAAAPVPAGGDMSELGELFGGGPDGEGLSALGEMFGELGGSGDAGDLGDIEGLGELFGQIFGEMSGDGGLGDFAGQMAAASGLNPECVTTIGVITNFNLAILGPAMGSSAMTEETVTQLFASAAEAPTELQVPLSTLHEAAVDMIGKKGPEVQQILDSPAVSAASDKIDDYLEQHCDTDS